MSDIEKGTQSSHVQCPDAAVGEHDALTNDGQISSSSSQTSGDDTVDSHECAGGVKAYLTVFGAFLALFCTFGQMNSFGTYQTWYKAHQLHQLPPSTISWIGSLQLWVFFFSVCHVLLVASSADSFVPARVVQSVVYSTSLALPA
jgi:hypothetical protein